MNASSVLGYGAIGLGFLLAVLSFRLLSANPNRRGPIYIYMAFCLTIMAIGSFLQYSDSEARRINKNDEVEIKKMKEAFVLISQKLGETASPLQEAQNIVTGTNCSGGSSGRAMARGAEGGTYIAGAQSKISTADGIARQYTGK